MPGAVVIVTVMMRKVTMMTVMIYNHESWQWKRKNNYDDDCDFYCNYSSGLVAVLAMAGTVTGPRLQQMC